LSSALLHTGLRSKLYWIPLYQTSKIGHSPQLESHMVLWSLLPSLHAFHSIVCELREDSQGCTAYGGRWDAEVVYMEAEHTGHIEYVMHVLSDHSHGNMAHLGQIIPLPFRSLHFRYPLSSHTPRPEPSTYSMVHSLRPPLPFTSQPIHGGTHKSRANPSPFVSDSMRSLHFRSFCFCMLLLCVSIAHDMYLKVRFACR
jgi:hypothetical protein